MVVRKRSGKVEETMVNKIKSWVKPRIYRSEEHLYRVLAPEGPYCFNGYLSGRSGCLNLGQHEGAAGSPATQDVFFTLKQYSVSE